ncbi:MAG TPA: acyl-CoA dehydrogenase [Caulobacteraceae bacterium]|nr:acyl-CoA dehydrogenase [Caulobacteraceae bacterium]
MAFRPQVRDLLFTLNDVLGVGQLVGSPAFPEFDVELLAAVLETAGALAADVLAPLDQTGDRAGATFENGQVRAPAGFAAAYRAFADGGWGALAADPAYGGQGLPKSLELAVFEMVHAANMAFGLCPMLTSGAIEALHAHGSERQKALYLPKMISGQWTGAMNLTEPQAGSDLSALTTRAEPDGQGGYRLHGQKIFITWGDHDLTDNIVHLVLARLPDAPEGSRGTSLFVTSKRLVGDDGSLGEANAVRPGGIEHKLGIHGSPTCVMLYEGARAELVGEPNRGLAHMFTMMNAARLNVGVEGVGVAERAYQRALAYALERRQGRSPWSTDRSAPIFDHPDVRRMLADMRARIEAARAICLLTALSADVARAAPDEETRAAAKLREELLTPIAKAWSTDMAVEVASIALQVHGGAGFIEETGAAQSYRDARIAPIYEGTNGIQAIDLVGRKLAMAGGEGFRSLTGEMAAFAQSLIYNPNRTLDNIGLRLAGAVDGVRNFALLLQDASEPERLAAATPFLNQFGDVVGGWLLARGAKACAERAETDAYAKARIEIAGYYAETVMTESAALSSGAVAAGKRLAALSEEALS